MNGCQVTNDQGPKSQSNSNNQAQNQKKRIRVTWLHKPVSEVCPKSRIGCQRIRLFGHTSETGLRFDFFGHWSLVIGASKIGDCHQYSPGKATASASGPMTKNAAGRLSNTSGPRIPGRRCSTLQGPYEDLKILRRVQVGPAHRRPVGGSRLQFESENFCQ